MPSATDSPLVISSCADLISAIPYLLGYHPTDSLVIIGLADARVTIAGRLGLGEANDARVAAHRIRTILAREDVTAIETGLITAGMVAYAARHDVETMVAPVTGEARDASDAAFLRELHRLMRLTRAPGGDPVARAHADGIRLLEQYATGPDLPDDDATARLVFALVHRRVRDHAWALIDEHGPTVVMPLLLWLTRRAAAGYTAAPATLAALVAAGLYVTV